MNDLSIVFENHPVRNVFQDGEWWFCAKDIGSALGTTSSIRNLLAGLDDKHKGVYNVHTPGGTQQLVFVDEQTLYQLIFASRVEGAARFREYVCDLIKQARQGKLLTLEQLNAALEQQKAELNAENLKLIEAVAKQHETLQVVESMFDTDGCMEMKDAVKVLKEYFCDEGSSLVGRNKLFAFLRDTKVLMENNLPYQDYSKHFVVNVSTGTIYLKNKSLVWLKRFVSKRVPKKASVLQIAHARKMFDLNIQP